MTPQQIELHIIDLVRQLAAQAQSDYSSVKLEVNISTGKESETIRPEWGCYTPTYGWTQGKTFGGAMEAQGDKLKRRAELIAKAQEMMAEAAKLETQP